jgi:hypothetical protein
VPELTIDAPGGVDNVALDFTLAALKSRRVCFRFYETHLSAIQANTQTSAWFPCSHENKRGPGNPGTPPSTRPQTFASEGRRKALRAPYTGITFFSRQSNRCLSPQLREQVFGWSRPADFGYSAPQEFNVMNSSAVVIESPKTDSRIFAHTRWDALPVLAAIFHCVYFFGIVPDKLVV